MWKKTDVERERLEARRKFQLDFNTTIKAIKMAREEAYEQGRREGREEGRREAREGRREPREAGLQEACEKGLQEARLEGTIAMIHIYEYVLLRPETPKEQLACRPLADLLLLLDDLVAQEKQRAQAFFREYAKLTASH